MTTLRFVVISIIFASAGAAWAILGGNLEYRTSKLQKSLAEEVNNLWGPSSLVQKAPYLQAVRGYRVEPIKTEAAVEFEHHNRYKGLLWFSTYTVNFSGEYTVQAPITGQTGKAALFNFELPHGASFFENLRVSLDGQIRAVKYKASNGNILVIPLPADNAPHRIAVSYKTRGRDRWEYALSRSGKEPILVKDFKLTARTNFKEIDYPGGSVSPSAPATEIDGDKGVEASWEFDNVRMAQTAGIEMPARLNAGPIAARMSLFAPVSLFFFFTVLFTIVVLKKIQLHPMHYLVISAGFFAFHILLAYLVDIMNIHAAFWICSAVSGLLVVSYMRLVCGVKFAVLYVGLAQLIYLIGFSYAFFYPGRTGLTVTIGAIITLFVLMQLTGRVNWHDAFGKTVPLETVLTNKYNTPQATPKNASETPPPPPGS